MEKIITCGLSCPDGMLYACPLDEKNLTTDWIEEFLFDCACIRSSYNSKICGYVNFGHEDMLCEVEYNENGLIYRFPFYTLLTKNEVNVFATRLEKFLEDCDNMTVSVLAEDFCGYCKPEITVKFYSRYDS